jgi:predicted esterase
MQNVLSEMHTVEKKYPVDNQRVILSGMSGGGMGAHGLAEFYPDEMRAIVVNTGMMAEGSHTSAYPNNRLAVFLASPTDFRYDEMHRDQTFLQSHNWRTHWLEFSGGHTLAPPALYAQAAQWLEQKMK